MQSNEPEFRAWRKRRLARLAVLCVLAIPVGLYLSFRVHGMTLPRSDEKIIGLVVSLLGLIGLIVSLVKMEKLK